MAEELQDVASAPQEPQMTADELWDTVDNEDSAEGGSDETVPESVNEEVAVEAEPSEEIQEEEPQHDWEKRYKDLEKDYHKRNEDNASFKRDTESKQSELERQLQSFQIERLENKERLQKLHELEKAEPEKPNTIENLLSEQEMQTMKDFEEVMTVVNKIVDHKLGSQPKDTNVPEVQQKLEEIEKAQQEIQYQRYLDYYDKEMKNQVGEDYLDIAQNDEFNAFWQNEPTLKDAVENSQDPKRHAFVAQMWLNTDEGRKFRGGKSSEMPKASAKQEQKRETAKSLAKNTVPPQEVDTNNMNEDELWEHIISQEED